MTSIVQRLNKLREVMAIYKVDFYLIPSVDPHYNEYVPNCWQRKAWISGFNGSAGEVLVTKDKAYLWTDGRYYLQAGQQLDLQQYTIMYQTGEFPTIESWLHQFASGKTLGVDPKLVSINRAEVLESILSENAAAKLEFIEDNLIDVCRTNLRDVLSLPDAPIFILEDKYTGESIGGKLSWLRSELNKYNTEHFIISALDEIAWILNLRGADIEYNPLFISYLLVSINEVILFVDMVKIDSHVKTYLNNNGVQILSYEFIGDYLLSLSGHIWLDHKTTSYWIYNKLDNTGNELKLAASPIIYRKACKNLVECDGARLAHIKDAVAVINYLYWITKNWQNISVTELSGADKLAKFRQQQKNLIGLSFNTISGFAENGAVIHYSATAMTNKTIDDSSLYLIDSGGQYLEGTTDVTRTIHLGVPTVEQKRHYTLVLKGHLALSRAVFPHKTCGEHLDVLARMHLWHEHLNYNHGTGHGVGSCLCVHEGPHRISPVSSNVPLVSGMIVSNEPGLYLNGDYGIRIENLCLVVTDDVANTVKSGVDYGLFYKFETLTLIPYCKNLIDFDLLTKEEKLQLINYYSMIYEKVLPLLSIEVQEWLHEEMMIY